MSEEQSVITKRCERLAAHVSHTWWISPDEGPRVRYFCKGVTFGAQPAGDDPVPPQARINTLIDEIVNRWWAENAPVTSESPIDLTKLKNSLKASLYDARMFESSGGHDPDVNCDCQPYDSYTRCEYRMLADAVIDNLPVHDGEDAEVSLCVDAVSAVGGALRVLRTPPGES